LGVLREYRLQRTVFREALNDVVRRPREDLNDFETSNFIVRLCAMVVEFIIHSDLIVAAAPPTAAGSDAAPPSGGVDSPNRPSIVSPATDSPTTVDATVAPTGSAPTAGTDTPAALTDTADTVDTANPLTAPASPAPASVLTHASSATSTPASGTWARWRASSPAAQRDLASGSAPSSRGSLLVSNLASIVRMSISMAAGDLTPGRSRTTASAINRPTAGGVPPLAVSAAPAREDSGDEVHFACTVYNVLLRTACPGRLCNRSRDRANRLIALYQ